MAVFTVAGEFYTLGGKKNEMDYNSNFQNVNFQILQICKHLSNVLSRL